MNRHREPIGRHMAPLIGRVINLGGADADNFIRITEHLDDTAVSGKHIVVGESMYDGRRIEVGFPADTMIEFVEDVAPPAAE